MKFKKNTVTIEWPMQTSRRILNSWTLAFFASFQNRIYLREGLQ